ncbi:hypothetical protein HIM_07160 [Hirsutella minnesotensis 3608]|uniref:25S rRNA adenine-N(1) methyltransferase n=1 Tax=Hirsutella minnesotensis 3608 TaxID=1043627 RepID=A0A0F7ZI26_9HYPO|nr:hypothetical protein HIM_07160 [Hirsutella minnesotensis 3608]
MGAKKKTLKSLRSGRPPTATASRSMSRKASRTLINSHHQLEKKRRQAIAEGDADAEKSLSAEIATLGGLKHYQRASLQGQSLERGGDTSKVLLEWLNVRTMKDIKHCPRMLEVGSLSTRNACSLSGFFDMVHIDLNSQEPGIQQQDFMERPLPESDADRFDLISLSLVLNFVPDAALRGQMLLRTLSFLRRNLGEPGDGQAAWPGPLLFLVLPRSCLDNSRYMSASRFTELLETLGYKVMQEKSSQKLWYSLWKLVQAQPPSTVKFTKREVNPGRSRNNFSITLDHPPEPTTKARR